MKTVNRILRTVRWKIWNKFGRYINWHIAKYGHTGLLYSEDPYDLY